MYKLGFINTNTDVQVRIKHYEHWRTTWSSCMLPISEYIKCTTTLVEVDVVIKMWTYHLSSCRYQKLYPVLSWAQLLNNLTQILEFFIQLKHSTEEFDSTDSIETFNWQFNWRNKNLFYINSSVENKYLKKWFRVAE